MCSAIWQIALQKISVYQVHLRHLRSILEEGSLRQYWVEKAGGPENLQIREAHDPIPRTGEVRIRVTAAGVNFMDVLGRAGILRGDVAFPFTPGLEVAGTIDAVGQGVTGLKEGDEVFALTG